MIVFIDRKPCIYLLLFSLFFFLFSPKGAAQPLSAYEGGHLITHFEKNPFLFWLQDEDGFIWGMDMNRKLIRYNGYQVETLIYSPTDTTGISGPKIRNINLESSGKVWIDYGNNGIDRFDPTKNRFEHFHQAIIAAKGENPKFYNSFLEDSRGYIWIGTQIGLYKYDQKEKVVSFELANDYTHVVFEDPNGNVWAGDPMQESIRKVFPKSGTAQESIPFPFIGDPSTFDRYSLSQPQPVDIAAKGLVFIAYIGNLYQFSSSTNAITPIIQGLHEGEMVHTIYGKDEELLVGTDKGRILKFNFLKKELEPFIDLPKASDIFDPILQTFQTKDGLLWIVTLHRTYKVLPNLSPFKTIPFPAESRLPKLASRHESLVKFNGNVYFNTEQGLVPVLSGTTAPINLVFSKTDILSASSNLPHSAEAAHTTELSTFIFREDTLRNKLWLLLYQFPLTVKLYRFDINGQKELEYVCVGRDTCFIDTYFDIDIDPNGHPWLGGWRGLKHFNPDTKELTSIYTEENGLYGVPVESVLCDSNGDVWVGHINRGLARYHPEKDTLEWFTADPNNPNSISTDYELKDVLEDSKGNIWIATIVGLNCYDKTNNTFIRYGNENGLPNEGVLKLTEDKNGDIWILYRRKIVKFNSTTQSFYTFSELSGLNAAECDLGISFGDDAGNLFYQTSEGMFYFHPDSVIIDSILPRLHFTDFQLANQSVKINDTTGILSKNINYTESINLNWDQRIFSIEYVAMEFLHTENTSYAFQLEGYDKDWRMVGGVRKATYTNLPQGTYTFKAKCRNHHGFWSEPIQFGINILPPWWLTWWAYLGYTLMTLGILYAAYSWRMRAQQKKLVMATMLNERLTQLDKLKDQFLANTSHELKTPLHGIIGIAESLFDKVENKSKEDLQENLGLIVASGRRLSSLVNDLLDFSRAKNKDLQLQLKSLDLKSLVDVTVRSCQTLLGNSSVQLKNQIAEGLPPILADDNRLQQILFNLIGNAIKFTEKGAIAVQAKKENGMIELCVADTGIGIPKEKQAIIFQSFEQADGSTAREYGGTGLGLSITKQLVELHGGQIWLDSKPREGTKFFFTIPISNQPTQLVEKIPSLENTFFRNKIKEVKLALPLAGSAEDRIRILVVDDEPINHQVLRNYLSGNQFLLTAVMSGKEAMETIELGVAFDLVLLDVMMPRMSGYEVCEKIRAKYLPSELPIIMVTAKNQIADLVEGLNLGANDYIAKPFSKEEFLARVKTQLDLHRIYSVTEKFVPNEFIRTLGKERITEVQLGDHAMKEVTVLFSDIRDFTTLAEKMSPEDTYKFVNAYNGRMGPIIQKHNGFVNQYLGDGIMAIFPHHPSDALNAAIEMQKTLATYNLQRKKAGRIAIRIGIGIHNGPLIMGIIGDKNRMDAATIADTVNTASRIENRNKYFKTSLLVSESIVKKLLKKDNYHLRFLGKEKLKGKVEGIGLYECFSGGHKQEIALKKKSLADFEEGVLFYLAKKYTSAAASFNNVLLIHPSDSTTQLFFNKAEQFRLENKADDWLDSQLRK